MGTPWIVMDALVEMEKVQHRDYSAVGLAASRKVLGFVRLSLRLCDFYAAGR